MIPGDKEERVYSGAEEERPRRELETGIGERDLVELEDWEA